MEEVVKLMNKLPIGIQSFEKIRTDDFLYIDKTAYIYKLVCNNIPYFLSRPRRFGKSLLLSTMKAYWEGKKELFEGLDIIRLMEGNPEAWKPYPVFYFDFNGVNYQVEGALEKALDSFLGQWEREYGLCGVEHGYALEERFGKLLEKAHTEKKRRCVVLVDEYDKPLLDLAEEKGLLEHNKEVFKAFFGTLKSKDEHIQFVFITGVTKFHKVSIFSDINQLTDISLEKDYAALCGITKKELEKNLSEQLNAMVKKCQLSKKDCIKQLAKQYDGYLFHPYGAAVYNPFSLLTSLRKGEFGSYWFETGTPSFLIKKLRQSHFEVNRFTDHTLYAGETVLTDYTGDDGDPIPLLYQTGYLTIVGYDKKRGRYTLGVPNEEVKYGLFQSLFPSYVPAAKGGNGLDIFTLEEYIETGRL